MTVKEFKEKLSAHPDDSIVVFGFLPFAGPECDGECYAINAAQLPDAKAVLIRIVEVDLPHVK